MCSSGVYNCYPLNDNDIVLFAKDPRPMMMMMRGLGKYDNHVVFFSPPTTMETMYLTTAVSQQSSNN